MNIIFYLYYCPVAAKINYHKFSVLEEIFTSQFWRPKVLNQGMNRTILLQAIG
jgi:hypothetical protein